MKIVSVSRENCIYACLLSLVCSISVLSYSQRPINSIVTSGSTASAVSYTNIKGAGLRNPNNSIISSWDSLQGGFNVTFNYPYSYNKLSITQFSVTGLTSSVIKLPVNATVKVRRLANTDVGDARPYYNFWAAYTSSPAVGATSGNFNFIAPEVITPEDAFLTNNLTSGYDNLFQNTIASPHFGNIERVDFIIPEGLKASNDTDLTNSGFIVIDRGGGDPFKISAITTIDDSVNPSAYGNLVAVAASNFGNDLLSSNIDYAIMIRDSKYYNEPRPSTKSSQNLKGVFISLKDLGLAVGQTFYGYSLFGSDVSTANPDWTTYPNNSNSGNQLDPVNVTGIYKTTYSLLPVSLNFSVAKNQDNAKLNFTVYNKLSCDHIIVERSSDNHHFEEIGTVSVGGAGSYQFDDENPKTGVNYYRLKMVEKNGNSGYTDTRMLKFSESQAVNIFPNPVSKTLYIAMPANWFKKQVFAELFNSGGQLIQQINIESAGPTEYIQVTNQAAGIYLLRLINKESGETISKQIMVKN